MFKAVTSKICLIFVCVYSFVFVFRLIFGELTVKEKVFIDFLGVDSQRESVYRFFGSWQSKRKCLLIFWGVDSQRESVYITQEKKIEIFSMRSRTTEFRVVLRCDPVRAYTALKSSCWLNTFGVAPAPSCGRWLSLMSPAADTVAHVVDSVVGAWADHNRSV